MSDTTQGQDAAGLFQEATGNLDIEQFENSGQLPASAPAELRRGEPQQGRDESEQQPDLPLDDQASIPPGRLREVNEARRQAERERDDLRAQLAALQAVQQQMPRQGQQPQAQQPKSDIFDNPEAYVQSIVEARLGQYAQAQQERIEKQSAEIAQERYGRDKVDAAYTALAMGMRSGDPNVYAVWQHAQQNHDPFGFITRWHLQNEMLQQIGGDLGSYNERYQQELLKNPEFLKTAMEAMRQQAQQSGQQVFSPALRQTASRGTAAHTSAPQFPPSLSDFGAAAPDENQNIDTLDDHDAFRQAVSLKRRRT